MLVAVVISDKDTSVLQYIVCALANTVQPLPERLELWVEARVEPDQAYHEGQNHEEGNKKDPPGLRRERVRAMGANEDWSNCYLYISEVVAIWKDFFLKRWSPHASHRHHHAEQNQEIWAWCERGLTMDNT